MTLQEAVKSQNPCKEILFFQQLLYCANAGSLGKKPALLFVIASLLFVFCQDIFAPPFETLFYYSKYEYFIYLVCSRHSVNIPCMDYNTTFCYIVKSSFLRGWEQKIQCQ
jgi:hypothetical protein